MQHKLTEQIMDLKHSDLSSSKVQHKQPIPSESIELSSPDSKDHNIFQTASNIHQTKDTPHHHHLKTSASKRVASNLLSPELINNEMNQFMAKFNIQQT